MPADISPPEKPSHVMRGFPPEVSHQVTLANWRQPSFNRWAFHHVGEIVPSATIAAEPRLQASLGAPVHHAAGHLAFEAPDGRERTVGEVLPATFTDALVVMRRGRVVHEWYDQGLGPARPHIVFSISKSLTGMLAGIVADRGLLDPAAPVTRYVPEAEGFAYGECTVQHLLDMTASVEFEEGDTPDGPFLRYRQAMNWDPAPRDGEPSDLRSFLVSLGKGAEEHGAAFRYLSPNSDMLGWVIERATARRFPDLFSEAVWQPLGAFRDASITVDRLGAPRTAGGISTTARDLALFGEMVRCRGAANGRQIVPGWWLDDTLTQGSMQAWARGDYKELPVSGPYRNQWYVVDPDRETLCAIGIHGQWLYVDRASETVVARFASQPEPENDETDALMLAAFAALADGLP